MTSVRQALQARRHLDRRLAELGRPARFAMPTAGWLRAIREALGMSAPVLARRLGITAQAVHAMESSEAEGRIRLDTLRKAADAMDCVLIYAVVPRTSLQEVVEAQAERVAHAQVRAAATSMALEDQAVEFDDAIVKRHAAQIAKSGLTWRAEV
jgi:predicted DNA-binding mobile mystery protein A